MSKLIPIAFAALATPLAAASVSLTSYQLAGGYGQVNLNPGVNVSHYVIFGDEQNNPSSAPAYAYSGVNNPISMTVGTDREMVYSNYESGVISFTDSVGHVPNGTTGNGIPADGQTKFIKTVVPLSTAYGGVGASYASVGLSVPATDFKFELLMHNFHAEADMQVRIGGTLVAEYAKSIKALGDSRNTDYLYSLSFSGMTVGSDVEVSFVNLVNTGSTWSNIGFFAASVNLDIPSQFEEGTVSQPKNEVVPEPSVAILTSVLGIAGLLRRRRHG